MEMVSEAVLDRHGRRVSKAAVIFREGEAPDAMYFIRAGRVKLLKRVALEDVCLAVLGPGEFFGELSLPPAARAVTAVAEEDTTLVAIGTETFEQMLSDSPALSLRLVGRLGARLRAADQRLVAAMTREGPARVAAALLQLGAEGRKGTDGKIWLSGAVDDALVASQAGVLPSLVAQLRHLLAAAGVLGVDAEGRWWIVALRDLEDFAEYCDRKRQLDPLTIEELASLAGLGQAEAEVLSERVAAKRLSLHEPSGGGRVVQTPLQRYLELKLRFEFVRSKRQSQSDHEGSR